MLALTLIVNQSLSSGIFPNKLKIAKVIPIFKKDDAHSLNNYRPISLLPPISKVFEKVVQEQLTEFLNVNKLLYNSQYGFRKAHSTETATLELIDTLLQTLDKKDIPISILFYLSKAFDTIDHNMGPFKCYVTLFSGKLDPHPPPRNANNIEHYTVVTFFPRKSNTPPTPICVT